MATAAPAEHWDALRQDVRWSLRMMRRDPLFSALAVAVLALGIGAASAVFSVADAALLRPLPYPDPHRLVAVLTTGPPETGSEISFPDLLDWRDEPGTWSNAGKLLKLTLMVTAPAERITGWLAK